jgi:hypothetical protein
MGVKVAAQMTNSDCGSYAIVTAFVGFRSAVVIRCHACCNLRISRPEILQMLKRTCETIFGSGFTILEGVFKTSQRERNYSLSQIIRRWHSAGRSDMRGLKLTMSKICGRL